MKDGIEQKSQKCYNDGKQKSDNKVGKSYNEIAEVDDGEHSIFLLFECRSCIYILGIEDDIFVFEDNSFE